MRLLIMCLLCLIGAAPTTQPEIRRGLPHGATTNPDDRARMGFARLIRRVEPSMKGNPNRLEAYIDAFRREYVEDPRLMAFFVQAEANSNGEITLTGFCEFVEHRQSLLRFLNQLGFNQIDDRIRVPLSHGVGFVGVDRSFVYDRTAAPRETVTEVLRDEPLFVLNDADGYATIHCADGYVGYIPTDAIRPVERSEFAARMTKFESDATSALLDRVIAEASKRLGAKYVWGGRSSEGVDCSGLVQTAFKSQGINLPRDADQQAGVGRMVATRAAREGLRRGDLLFFLGRTGTVRHVAIYLGDQKYIQSADEGVHVSSFDATDPAYDEKHDKGFCFAKRVIE